MEKETSTPSTLILTGMHRSGTSLIASLLHSAGVNLGKEFLDLKHGNVKGHFENIEFYEFHRSVLYSVGVSQDGWTLEKNIKVPEQFVAEAKELIQKNTASPVWGWKDPRTTLFLNFWLTLIPEAKFIFIYRSPWEVIDSLFRRGDLAFVKHPNFALEVWFSYNQKILEFHENNTDKCLLFNLEQLIQHPNLLHERVQDKFSIVLQEPENLYEESLLNRNVKSSHRPTLIKKYFPEAYQLYCQLNDTVGYTNDNVKKQNDRSSIADFDVEKEWILQDWLDIRNTQNQLNDTQNQLNEVHTILHETQVKNQKETQQVHTQLHQTQVELLQYQAQIAGMESSKFWKLRSAWFRLKQKLGFNVEESP